MQKAISKYGLAAHLALLAVAPLFLFPYCGDVWTARVVLWLSLLVGVWMMLEPSRRQGELLHEARFRVSSSMVKDPLFWVSVALVAISAVRYANGGVAMAYDAERLSWRLASPAVPFLPGSVTGGGYLPFATVVGVAVSMQAARHALGKSARLCFLFVASFLAAIAAVSASMACVLGNRAALAFAGTSLADPTYPGTAFGICLMGSMIALVGSFEWKWKRPLPLLVFSVGGCALGLYMFAPDFLVMAYAAAAAIVLVYSLAYAHMRIGGLVVPKCLAILLIAALPPILFVMGAVPDSVKSAKFAFLFEAEGAHVLPDGFFELRNALSAIAAKVWGEHPWIGTGLGSFGLDIRFQATESDWTLFCPGQSGALNGWLQMLAERGIAGAVFFIVPPLFLAWTYVSRAANAVRSVLSQRHRRLSGLLFSPSCLLGVLAVAIVAACGFFDHSFWRPETMMVVVAVFAMAGSAFPAGRISGGE